MLLEIWEISNAHVQNMTPQKSRKTYSRIAFISLPFEGFYEWVAIFFLNIEYFVSEVTTWEGKNLYAAFIDTLSKRVSFIQMLRDVFKSQLKSFFSFWRISSEVGVIYHKEYIYTYIYIYMLIEVVFFFLGI